MLTRVCCIVVSGVAQSEEDDIKNLQDSILSKTGINATGLPTADDAQEIFKKKCIKEGNQEAYDKATVSAFSCF